MLWDWDDSLSHEISQQLRIITCFCCSVCCQLFWNCCSCSYSYSLNWTWTLVDGLELFGNGCLVNLTWTWLWSYGRVCNFICLRSQCRVLSLWGLCCSVCGLFWNLWIFMERSCKHLQLNLEDSPNGTLEMHWKYLGWCYRLSLLCYQWVVLETNASIPVWPLAKSLGEQCTADNKGSCRRTETSKLLSWAHQGLEVKLPQSCKHVETKVWNEVFKFVGFWDFSFGWS